MGTPGYIVRPTTTGSWEAVRVSYDGHPEGLGAALVKALSQHGPAKVLKHAFATSGWTGWPASAHHPSFPEDSLITPETIWESSYSYLIDAKRNRLEIREELDLTARPTHRLRISQLRGDELGVCDLGPLVPPLDQFERQSPRPEAVEAMLASLGLSEDHVGVATGIEPWNRHLHLNRTVVHLRSLDFHGAVFKLEQGATPMPDVHEWIANHRQLFEQVTAGLAFSIEADARSHMVWLALFDALFEEAKPLR